MTQNKAGARAVPHISPPPERLTPGERRALRRQGKPSSWRRFLLWVTGWFCIFLGVLGIFLPILQGILFLLIGLFILSRVSPRIRLFRQKLKARARVRYPKWTGTFEEAEARGRRMVNRVLKPAGKRS